MKSYLSIAVLFLSFVSISCGERARTSGSVVASLDTVYYASGFMVTGHEGYTVAEVADPWDSTKILQRYILIDRDQPMPSGIPQGTILRVPVKNVVVYSTVHVAMLDLLGEVDKVVGVCETEYISTPAIREGLAEGRIADLGQSTTPNVEKMIEIGTEVIIASPFQNTGYGTVEKLGFPIVEGADYMERSPLGRAEWIRFYGLLFNRTQKADSLFRKTEERYLALKKVASAVQEKPSVLSEKRYGATWFVPGGDSYMAEMYADAGADYVFKDLPGSGSLALSFETVLDKAIHADYWLMKYHDDCPLTYKTLRGEYTPYENFDAFKKKQVYGSNSAEVPYYEEAPLHPDYLLEDLVKIFHPELLPEHTLRYFRPLDD
ncbi:MAG: ABC transporter substrate-binding protein [Massilibacteroides sp.]|nr:ABC transporter substrate-binding protein [Massilibacteroides sp.]MDD3063034.1 ABC transporter substrate-binding protein [Massilibacteroides sp.]MDD4114189.1 ABC transporter substrate-binding protein [Massilibacteroides sp.]MDD4660543.1 ABC transporter substrate-binding protein [Massilibacteroides sp.]